MSVKKIVAFGFVFLVAQVGAFAAKCRAFLCQEVADSECNGYCYDHCHLGDSYFVAGIALLLFVGLFYWRQRRAKALDLT